MSVGKDRFWIRGGALFVREGWFTAQDGRRYRITESELFLRDGYFTFNGAPPTLQAPEKPIED